MEVRNVDLQEENMLMFFLLMEVYVKTYATQGLPVSICGKKNRNS